MLSLFRKNDIFVHDDNVLQINYILSFEEITLKFISVSEQVIAEKFFGVFVHWVSPLSFIIYHAHLQDALRTFLLRKLDNLTKDDKCQITMISTWATELYLDKVFLRLS